jgi:DNA-binding HxlR family transcriptional regulator
MTQGSMLAPVRRTPLDKMACSIARTVDLVGEWWTPLILRDLFAGIRRFEDLRRDLGIASNVLDARLNRMTKHGIVERRRYHDTPPRFEYVLTEKGRDLYPVLATIMAWGDKWLAGEEGPPALMVHEDCGQVTSAVVVCSHCGVALSHDRLRLLPGPGGRPDKGTSIISRHLHAGASSGRAEADPTTG